MSHVSKIELEIRSLEELKEACRQIGLRFKENKKTYAWFGEWVGDYPMPPGFKVEDLGKCDHAINVPGCEYEIGVVRKDGKLSLIWDFWKSGGLEKKLGKGCGKLKQAYAAVKIRNEARMKGYRVTQTKIKKGIRLVLAA